jgi:hypothetical protein
MQNEKLKMKNSRVPIAAIILTVLLSLASGSLAAEPAVWSAAVQSGQAAPVASVSATVEALPPLPQVDQAALVQSQLDRLGEMRRKLQSALVAKESNNFILFSDLDPKMRNAILIWLEDLRTKLMARLSISAEQRLWDGKCLVVVFAQQDALDAFARRFDQHLVTHSRGYFVLEARQVVGPRLVHIATYQPAEGGIEHFRDVLVHESTHALVEMYRDSVALPLWVHEGLAEYMTVEIDPGLRADKEVPAYQRAGAAPYVSIQRILTEPFGPSDIQAYAVSLSLIDFLSARDPDGVRRFLDLMKDGTPGEEALGQAYPGLNYKVLERSWRSWCLRWYAPGENPKL